MAQFENLKNAIRQVIKRNGNEEITGDLLQQVLIAMVNALGAGYQFVGVATPDADPGTTDNRLCYLAGIPGTYTHFGGIVIEPGETAFLTYGTSWNKITIVDSPVIWVDIWDLTHYASIATKIAVFKVLRDAIIQRDNKTVICFNGEHKYYPIDLFCPEDTQDYVKLLLLTDEGIVYSFSMEAEIDAELEITGVDVRYQEDIRFANDADVKSEIQRAKDAEYQIQHNVEMLDEKLQQVSQRELDTDADFEQRITDIEGKIPAQATAENQLADKAFVNSSIATNTANFIGTFNSLEELEQYPTAELTNNDYAFVIGSNSEGNRVFSRYKWNGEEWLFEYELNNSSFTSGQWETINSGLTSDDVTSIRAALTLIGNVIPDDASVNNKLVSRKYVEDRHIVLPLLTLEATQEQLALVYNGIMNAPTGSAFFISLPENRGIMPLATAQFATSVFAQYADGRYSHELKITLADGVYAFEKTDKTFATKLELDALQTKVGDLSDLETTDKTSIVNAINSSKVFVAEYGVTTLEEIMDAYDSGKVLVCKGVYSNIPCIYSQVTLVSKYLMFYGHAGSLLDVAYVRINTETGEWTRSRTTSEASTNKKTTIDPTSDTDFPTSKAVASYVAELEWDGTQAEYDALTVKNPNVTYYIHA